MNSCFRSRVTGWLLLALLLLTAPAFAAKQKGPKIRDVADTLASNPIMTKFAAMVEASDMGTFLSSKGPFTVFVPTDSAFARLPPGALELLLQPQNKERLQMIVLFHVVNGKRLASLDMKAMPSVQSCQGLLLNLKTSHSGTQYVQKAKITHTDIKCANGIINQIDTVLMPPEAAMPPVSTTPPPPPTPATNAPGAVDSSNAAPSPNDTNAIPTVPIAPVAPAELPPR